MVKDLPVYWINLQESCQRREQLLEEFRRHHVNAQTRIEAICPPQLTHFAISSPSGIPEITPKEYCCTLSHLKAIWTAFRNNDAAALIMEDDMRIIRWPGRHDVCSVLMTSAPDGWHILQLFSLGTLAVELLSHASLWVPWRSGIWSTGAYIINRDGMQAMLQKYVPQQVSRDVWYSRDSCVMVDFKNMRTDNVRARCVADWALYVAVSTYVCTDVWFTETAEESTINNKDLSCHRSSIKVIEEYARNKKFKAILD